MIIADLKKRARRRADGRIAAQPGQFAVLVDDRLHVFCVARIDGLCRALPTLAASSPARRGGCPGRTPSTGDNLIYAPTSPSTHPKASSSASGLEHADSSRLGYALLGEVEEVDRLGRGIVPVPSGDEIVTLAEGEHGSDVAMVTDVLHQCTRFQFTGHEAAGVGLVVRILVHEVAIEIGAPRSIFGDETVVVPVDPFVVEPVSAHFAALRIRPLQQTRIIRMDHIRAFRVLDAHQRDVTILIQVLGRVLVDPTVVIVVKWRGVGLAVRFDRCEEELRRIRIHPRNDIECMRIDLLLHLRAGCIVAEQVVDYVNRKLAAHQVIALEIGRHEQRRPGWRCRSGSVHDLHRPDRAIFAGLADFDKLCDVGVVLDETLKCGGQFRIGMIFRKVSGRGGHGPGTKGNGQYSGCRQL